MADLYLDHNVARQTAVLLRLHDHDVIQTARLGQARARDDEQLLTAASLRRTLITHDRRDFELLHDAWRRWSAAWQIDPPHFGILVIPQGESWSSAQAAGEVNRFLASGVPLANELYRWTEERGWVRRP